MKVRKNKFYILHFTFYIIFIPILLNISGCSSPTETPTGELSGVVNLEGMQDHSCIVIALYELAYLDTTITRINAQYPNIGIKITQHTEFDHRLQSPVKYTETLADGSFEITKIPTGKYNLVAMKSDFGFKYLYEIEIEEGENEISQARCHHFDRLSTTPEFIEGRSEISSRNKDQRLKIKNLKSKSSQPFDPSSLVLLSRRSEAKTDDPENRSSDLTLFPETVISGNIQENITVLPDHHLIIDDDTVFVPNTSSLTIHPGAVIRINPGVDLTIQGNLLAQGEENNMFWITSNDCFSQDLIPNIQDQIAIYNSMQLSEWASISDDLITWGKFDYANTCLLNQVNNLHIQNGIFRDANYGFYSMAVDSTFCEMLICKNMTNEEYSGIHYNYIEYGYIKNNIIINNNNGLKVINESCPKIFNNCIQNCTIGINISNYSSPSVYNNEIINCMLGIKVYSYYDYPCYPNIYLNDIIAEVGVFYGPYICELHNNNILSSIYVIELGVSDNSSINWFINAENNYYYTINEDEIAILIYDNNDVDPSQQEFTGVVYFQPYLFSEEHDAGI